MQTSFFKKNTIFALGAAAAVISYLGYVSPLKNVKTPLQPAISFLSSPTYVTEAFRSGSGSFHETLRWNILIHKSLFYGFKKTGYFFLTVRSLLSDRNPLQSLSH